MSITTNAIKFSAWKCRFSFYFGGSEKKSYDVFPITTELEILLIMLCSNEWNESSQLNGLPCVKVWKCLAKGTIKKAIYFFLPQNVIKLSMKGLICLVDSYIIKQNLRAQFSLVYSMEQGGALIFKIPSLTQSLKPILRKHRET